MVVANYLAFSVASHKWLLSGCGQECWRDVEAGTQKNRFYTGLATKWLEDEVCEFESKKPIKGD